MRRLVSMALVALAGMTASAAFDRTAWLEKRRIRTEEALRLRTAYTNCVANLETPAEDVNVTLETFDDGAMKTVVTAKRAQFFLKTGLVWAQGVELRKLKQDGSAEALIVAENCVIDRLAKAGWAEGKTTVTHGDTVISGNGVYFSSPESYIRIFNDADVESKNLKMGGLRP